MTYRVIIPSDLQQEIWDLPDQTRNDVIALIASLRDNPDRATGPYGIEDTGPERMRQAAVGSTIVVVLINDTTGNVQLVQITHLD